MTEVLHLDSQIAAASVAEPRRAIIYRTTGQRHGPITRLISPGDVGELVKPFVFLDLLEAEASQGRGFAPHPHSGIATLTTFLEGRMTYADSTGKAGSLSAGSVEWMRAGEGVWHVGESSAGHAMRGYQLWVALPPELELAPPESLYIDPGAIQARGPVRVLLGEYDGVSSPIGLPVDLTYLHVQLKDGERWTYRPGAAQRVAWLALNSGALHVSGMVLRRELAVFEDGSGAIEMTAEGAVEMVIGSAVKHPHPLVTGYYSVHTDEHALANGERNIHALSRTPAVAALHARR